MKSIYSYLSFLLLFFFLGIGTFQIKAQPGWTTINSSRGNFSFSFPQNVSPRDTLSLLSYFSNLEDSSIALQVSFIDNVYIGGNEELQTFLANKNTQSASNTDPCYVDSIENVLTTYAQMYAQTTAGTVEGFVTSNYQPCVIRGKELTIRHPDLSGSAGYFFAFTRYYYWNKKFLAFTITGPEAMLTQLNAYKNQFFASIYFF